MLLEVSSVLLVDEHEIQIVSHAEFVSDVAIRGRQSVRSEEQSNGDRLASHGRAVHDFEFRNVFTLVVDVGLDLCGRRGGALHRIRSSRCDATRFALDDDEFHVLDFDAYEEEKDAANHTVGEVKSILGILEFNVQTVFDADFHFDGRGARGVLRQRDNGGEGESSRCRCSCGS